MNETLKNEDSVREYLLGRVSDEARLADFEELLFLDDEFYALVEIAEDALVNDFVFGGLNETDLRDFTKTLENNRERREKVALAKAIQKKAQARDLPEKESKTSFFESLRAFFQKPLNAGATAVLLIGILILSFYLLNRPKADELAELKAVYRQERPTEARLSGFDYAPLTATRGALEEREKSRLRRFENNLLERVEQNPSADANHDLGVFYLTQRKFDEAVAALEKAARTDEKNARILNDLGSAYFEKAKTQPPEKRLETLSKALENFSRAYGQDAGFLPALFNKSLSLQESGLYNEARESWNSYLEKDSQSGWAGEARKHLERLEQLKQGAPTKQQVLEDFLDAYRNGDAEAAWKINSNDREPVSGASAAESLSRRFIEAKIRGDGAAAAEALEALKFIGNLERERNADFFVADIAEFYTKTGRFEDLLKAKNLLAEGFGQINSKEIGKARASFEESRNLFEKAENTAEAKIAELWTAHALSDLSEINKSGEILNRLAVFSKEKNYRRLFLSVSDWTANNFLLQNDLSKATEIYKSNLELAAELSDAAFQFRMAVFLAGTYNETGEYQKSLAYLSRNSGVSGFEKQSDSRRWMQNVYCENALYRLGMFEAAESFGKEALFIARNGELKNSQAVYDSLRILTQISKSKRDFPQAYAYAEESLRIAEKTPDEAFRAKLEQYTLLEIADLKREMGKFDEAARDFDAVIERLEKTPEVRIDEYAARKGKLLCLQKLGKRGEMQTEIETLLALSEKYRAQILEEDARHAFFDNEQVVFDVAVETALEQNDAEKAFQYAETARARGLFDLMSGDASVAGLEKKFPQISKPLALAEIRQEIPPGARLVVYSALPEKLAVWVVSNEKFEFAESRVTADETARKIALFLELVRNEKENAERVKESSAELFEILVAPVLPALDGARTIVFVPDKSLNLLPFGALFSKSSNKFLIEDFALMNAPSASVFAAASAAARRLETIREESLLIIGNPRFDARENPLLADLPDAETEAREVAKSYRNSRRLTGAEATKPAVLSALAEKNIFHFAGHYVANAASAPNSKLLLAGGELRVSELTQLRLTNTKLVVLSACETASEKLYRGEGAIGAARAFLAIGAPLALASGWKIDSEAAKDLMISFHRLRREQGLTSAEALRRAQIEMLNGANPNYRTPYFWSAFSLVGGYANY